LVDKLKIRVADITEKARILESTDSYSHYPALVKAQESGECAFISPISTSLSVAREYDHLRVHGNIGSSVKLTCSRCLSEYSTDIASSFTIIYTRSTENQPEDEVELGEEDLISATYSGDEIDFTDEIAEQVLLEIPYKPLCAEECRGLCFTCGADLNSMTCSCDESVVSLKFSPLKGLTVKS
jgi:uncharacterized protein